MTSHAHCTHEKTKAARAACRRSRQSPQCVISLFALEDAYAINDMWGMINSAQESLLDKYKIVYATCEYCEQDHPCFQFEYLGINVCGRCERMNNVHEYEEKRQR